MFWDNIVLHNHAKFQEDQIKTELAYTFWKQEDSWPVQLCCRWAQIWLIWQKICKFFSQLTQLQYANMPKS